MSAQLSPVLALHVTDTIPFGKAATVALPEGTWALVSVTVDSDDATTKIGVASKAGTTMLAATATGATSAVVLAATAPAVTTSGSVIIGATVAGNIQFCNLVLRAAGTAVATRAVVVA